MRLAEEPLTKVTINIFTADYLWLRNRGGWSEEIRNAVRAYRRDQERKKASLSQGTFVPYDK